MTDPLDHDYVREPLGDIWGWVLASGRRRALRFPDIRQL